MVALLYEYANTHCIILLSVGQIVFYVNYSFSKNIFYFFKNEATFYDPHSSLLTVITLLTILHYPLYTTEKQFRK